MQLAMAPLLAPKPEPGRLLLRIRKQLAKLDLLVLYELGYVPVSKAGAELLFDVIATAYVRNSIVVTTNLPFENWPEVLGNQRLTGATLDRLTHRATSSKPRAKATGSRTPNEDQERNPLPKRSRLKLNTND